MRQIQVTRWDVVRRRRGQVAHRVMAGAVSVPACWGCSPGWPDNQPKQNHGSQRQQGNKPNMVEKVHGATLDPAPHSPQPPAGFEL